MGGGSSAWWVPVPRPIPTEGPVCRVLARIAFFLVPTRTLAHQQFLRVKKCTKLKVSLAVGSDVTLWKKKAVSGSLAGSCSTNSRVHRTVKVRGGADIGSSSHREHLHMWLERWHGWSCSSVAVGPSLSRRSPTA